MATESTGPMDFEQRKAIKKQLDDHMNAIFELPCRNFPNYPFKWLKDIDMEKDEPKVFIVMFMEHFGDAQKQTLLDKCNAMLKVTKYNHSDSQSVSNFLKASELKKSGCEGIQFEVADTFTQQQVMDQIKGCKYPQLWSTIKKYADFVDNCQIHYNVQKFGESTVSMARFIAQPAVPISIMLWLFRELNDTRGCHGFGKVYLVKTNGLPGGKVDIDLHFNSGLIRWE